MSTTMLVKGDVAILLTGRPLLDSAMGCVSDIECYRTDIPTTAQSTDPLPLDGLRAALLKPLVGGVETIIIPFSKLGPTLEGRSGNLVLVKVLRYPGNDPSTSEQTDASFSKAAAILLNLHGKKIPIAAAVLLHDMAEKKLTYAARGDILMFESIAGQQYYPKVLFGTQGWCSDISTALDGLQVREEELKATVWKPFIESGAQVIRLDTCESLVDAGTMPSIASTLAELVGTCDRSPSLKVVDEMSHLGLPFSETAAAKTLAHIQTSMVV